MNKFAKPANSVYERQVLFMRKKLFVFVPLFLVFTVIFTLITPAVAMSEDISTKVFRLHILANSDSEDDQKLKLKVRDKILSVSDKMYNNCATVDDAVNTAKTILIYLKAQQQRLLSTMATPIP